MKKIFAGTTFMVATMLTLTACGGDSGLSAKTVSTPTTVKSVSGPVERGIVPRIYGAASSGESDEMDSLGFTGQEWIEAKIERARILEERAAQAELDAQNQAVSDAQAEAQRQAESARQAETARQTETAARTRAANEAAAARQRQEASARNATATQASSSGHQHTWVHTAETVNRPTHTVETRVIAPEIPGTPPTYGYGVVGADEYGDPIMGDVVISEGTPGTPAQVENIDHYEDNWVEEHYFACECGSRR